MIAKLLNWHTRERDPVCLIDSIRQVGDWQVVGKWVKWLSFLTHFLTHLSIRVQWHF